jgi:hypothetical protein
MSNPTGEQREPDDLELDVETIQDLELKKKEEEQVRGGAGCMCSGTKIAGHQ